MTDALLQGDEVFVIGSSIAVEQLLRISGITFNQQLDRVIIVGASAIGIELARVLEERDTNVKLIEADQTQSGVSLPNIKAYNRFTRQLSPIQTPSKRRV